MGKTSKHLSLMERALLQTPLVLRSTITRTMARNGWVPEPEGALRGRPRLAGG